MRPFIVVGDRTSHGGVVITGSESTDVDGKPVARIGDQVTCPRKGHGSVTTIVTGDVTAIIDGRPLARHGDKTACGAMLISHQMIAYCDEGSSNGPGVSLAPVAVVSSLANSEPGQYDQHFQLMDNQHNTPLANRAYRIKWCGGTAEGRTDANGFTEKVAATKAEEVTIEVFAEGV